MIGLEISTSAKLTVISIILKCYYVLDLIFESISLVFYCKFCAFRIILFTLHVLNIFYQGMNKPNIHNNIIAGISSFKVGLTTFLAQLVSISSKVIEGSHKEKIICF